MNCGSGQDRKGGTYRRVGNEKVGTEYCTLSRRKRRKGQRKNGMGWEEKKRRKKENRGATRQCRQTGRKGRFGERRIDE